MKRFYVEQRTLTDGSLVFNVTNEEISIAACDERHANAACIGFNDAMDVAVGNYNAMPVRS